MEMYKPVIVKKVVNDEHYYLVNDEFYPSVTKILHESMPMPFALKNWLGEVGNEKAQDKLDKAGARGTAIHNACEKLLFGGSIRVNEEFTLESDKKCISSFVNWCADFQPLIKEPAHIEMTVASELKYAGTLDIFCYINNEPWIVDIKTSRAIYTEHKLQITAYQKALFEMTGIMAKRAILHLNPLTKKGYVFDDKMFINKKEIVIEDFITVYNLYLMINGGKIPEPPQTNEYPEIIKLNPKI